MEAWNRGHPEREFSTEVRKVERLAANNACRICGVPRSHEVLESAHIYTHSQNAKWERAGTVPARWKKDRYVASEANCLLLCQPHHRKVDSEQGLQICTVEYLESLKSDRKHCTALIEVKGEIRRCRRTTNNYRCHLHQEGGLEEQLVPRGQRESSGKAKESSGKAKESSGKAREGSCIIL